MQIPTEATFEGLGGKRKFAHEDWEEELSRFISTLLAEFEVKKHRSHNETIVFAQSLLTLLREYKTSELIHKTVLSLLLLTLAHPEVTKTQDFESVVQTKVLDQYPHDEILQACGNKLLEIAEDSVDLDLSSSSFEFPPFQKALPYFPSYGYQTTLIFADDKLDPEIQSSIISLVTELKGAKRSSYS